MTENATTIGLISDTHGLLRPEALDALRGADLILHAGDIGKPEILVALEEIAPVTAVRGNNDRDEWAAEISETETVHVGDVKLLMLHDLKELDIDPGARGYRVVVSGHSHKPLVEERDGVLYVNPGAAGPRRFKLPVSVARLRVSGRRVDAKIIELNVPAARRRRKV